MDAPAPTCETEGLPNQRLVPHVFTGRSPTDSVEIRIPKTAEIVAARIRNAIIDGDLKSGDRLPSEAQLIEQYRVSRPTIREAIRILEYENFIKLSRGARGGATVLEPTASLVTRATSFALRARNTTLGEIYFARMLIEPPAARLAAETRPHKASLALKAQLLAQEAATAAVRSKHDLDLVRLELAKFHKVLLEQSGNNTLGVFANALQELVNEHQALVYRRKNEEVSLEDRLKQIRFGTRSQERLVEMIAGGDGVNAEAHWRAHMKKAGEFWLDKVAHTSVVEIVGN